MCLSFICTISLAVICSCQDTFTLHASKTSHPTLAVVCSCQDTFTLHASKTSHPALAVVCLPRCIYIACQQNKPSNTFSKFYCVLWSTMHKIKVCLQSNKLSMVTEKSFNREAVLRTRNDIRTFVIGIMVPLLSLLPKLKRWDNPLVPFEWMMMWGFMSSDVGLTYWGQTVIVNGIWVEARVGALCTGKMFRNAGVLKCCCCNCWFPHSILCSTLTVV